MNPVPKDELETLMNETGTPCISIYIPTARGARDTRENPIRFRNALRRAEEGVEELGLSEEAREGLLSPLRGMVDDHDLWQHQESGLAVFRSGQQIRTYSLPFEPEELCTVEDRFHVKPLLSLYTTNRSFWLLELNLGRTRLFQADQYSMTEVDLDDPVSLEDAVGEDVEQQMLQYHSGRAAPNDPIYHSQGEGEGAEKKTEISAWFTRLRDSVERRVPQQEPVILSGVEYLFPLFRAVTHLTIADTGVRGSVETSSQEEIHAKAYEIAKNDLGEILERAEENIGFLEKAGRASSDLEEVVVAAADGRVATLYVSRDDHCWGRFDAEQRSVEIYDDERTGADDLLDRAAVETYLKGGRVFVVPPEELPNGGKLTAVYRYQL